jgi:hypothetical protein
VTHTFQTNGSVIGTQAPRVVWTPPKGAKGSANSSIIGSQANLVRRGTVEAAVSAAGKITLTFKGKPVAKLTAGNYLIKVVDQSKTAGFVLTKTKSGSLSVTDPAYVGTRWASVAFSRGSWSVATKPGAKQTAIVVG